MDWDEFLEDHELNTDEKYRKWPDGEYLFRKVSHDVLECLTAYRGCLELLSVLKNNDTDSVTTQCLNKWNIVCERWIAQITSLTEKYHKEYSAKSPKWANLIADMGNIVAETPTFKTDMETLILPKNDETRQMIELAVVQSKKLELLWIDIQNQDYKRLWTITQYGDLFGEN